MSYAEGNFMNKDVLIMFYEDYLEEEYGIECKDKMREVPEWYVEMDAEISRNNAITDRWTEMMMVEDLEE